VEPTLQAQISPVAACEAARESEEQTGRGELAELLRAWGPGEITCLVKALTILRDSHARVGTRYRQLSIVPRPDCVQQQLDFSDAAVRALQHAIGCVKRCGPRGTT